MSEATKSAGFSENLLLDDSAKGVIVTGITDDSIAAKSGLQPGDEIVGATIHLDHLNKNEVLKILKVLEPYDDNMKILTKKDLGANVDLGSFTSGLQSPVGDVNLEGPTFNDGGATVTVPSVGLSGPDVSADLQGNLKSPDVHPLPQKKLPKFTMPSFNLPHFKKPKAEADFGADVDVPAVSADLNSPNFALKEPDIDLNGPTLRLNSPEVSTEPINMDVDEPSGKFKWPHLKWKQPKATVPDASIGVDVPVVEGNLSGPNIDGSLDTPGVDFSVPVVDAQVPSHEARFGKINWPHLKWKKADRDFDPNLNLDSGLKVDGGINSPDIDLALPKADIDGLDVDMSARNHTVEGPSGKINWPHLKWKKPKGPKADIDLDAPKADIDANIDAPSANINWPHLKWKKPALNGPKTDMNLNADVSTPEGNVRVQGIEHQLSAPDANLDFPNASLHVKDVDAPSSKLKWPTFKKRKRSFPGLKGKDLDANLDMSVSAPKIDSEINADGNINLPEGDFESPKLELNADDVEVPSGKFKLFNFNKPKFGLTDPKVDLDKPNLESPELDLNMPDISGPKVDGTIDTPELNVSAPKADVDTDIGSKIKLPKFKLPSFKGLKLKTPEVETVAAPDLDLSSNVDPNMSLSLPNVGEYNAPKIEVPGVDLSAPRITGNLDSPDPKLDLDLGSHLPTLNLPTSTIDVSAPEPTVPSLDVKGSSVELPRAEIEAPAIDLKTDPGLNLSAPKTGDILFTPGSPKISTGVLEAPKVELKASDIDINMPEPDLNVSAPTADVGFDSHLGEFKSPQNLPQLSKLLPEAPSFDSSLETGIDGPKVSVDSDPLSGVISLPESDLTAPNVVEVDKGSKIDITPPQIDVSSQKHQLQHFNLPTINFSPLNVPSEVLNATADLKGLPEVDVKAPTVEGAISPDIGNVIAETPAPEVQVKDSPKSKIKLPFKWGFKSRTRSDDEGGADSEPDVPNEGGDILKGLPEVDVKAPTVEGAISPDIGNVIAETPAPEVQVKDSPKSKIKLPFKWGFKSHTRSDDEGGADSEPDVPNEGDDIPQFKVHPLPRLSFDCLDKSNDIFSILKHETEEKDYVMSKGVRLPFVNATAKTSEKVDIMERLKMAKENLVSSPKEAPASLPLVRGGTFKVERSESASDPAGLEYSALNEGDKLSLSLSNMLGLNTNDPNDD